MLPLFRTPASLLAAAWLTFMGLAAVPSAAAELAAEIARCRAEQDDAARLACYDRLAQQAAIAPETVVEQVRQALDREFTFSSRAWRDGPLGFQIPVVGVYSPANRAAAYPMPEVASVATKIQRALAGFEGWRLAVTVEPVTTEFGRSTPYTGGELLSQAEDALTRSGLAADRFTVAVGSPPPGRNSAVASQREANAFVHVDIEGLR